MRASSSNFGKNVLLLLTSVTVSLLVLEFAFRLWMGVPLSKFSNFRESAAVAHVMGTVVYDPELGWTHIPNTTIDLAIPFSNRRFLMKTMDYGIRQNGAGDTSIRTGGLLAVGDSFTAGTDVGDANSWPALLESIIQRPVINGGVGGYATDQIVIQAERLIPVVRPKVLLVGFLDQDIYRSGYSLFGAPKPYFTIENGELVGHKPKPPTALVANKSADAIRTMLGYSFLVDHVMKAYNPAGWLASYRQTFTKTGVDEIDVTCLLLKRLKQKAEQDGIRALLIMQYGGAHILGATQRSLPGMQVDECAAKMGYQIVDEFENLKALSRTNFEEFRSLYYVKDNSWGHMTEAGNLYIAKLVAAALNEPPASGKASNYELARFGAGDGQNLLPKSEYLAEAGGAGSIATLRRSTSWFGGRTEYTITAGGSTGEHYVGVAQVPLSAGPHTLSLEVRPDTTSFLRAQLVDEHGSGVIGDYDLKNDSAATVRLGKSQQTQARITEMGGGWYRVQLSAILPGAKTSIIFGVGDNKSQLSFSPQGESIKVRAVQLERGQTPSEYKPTK